MKLSKQEVKHIADLAHLELSELEQELYSGQLNSVLDYIDQLKKVNTLDVEPTAQVTGLENIMAEDEVEECDKQIQEKMIEQFPQRQGDYNRVKRMLRDS